MGSACCSTDSTPQTAPDTASSAAAAERPTKKEKGYVKYHDESSSDDGNTTTTNTTRDSESDVLTEPEYSTTTLKDKAIEGFKDAVEKGNDSLVMYFIQEHSALDLLDIKFANGDSVLHIAVRNKSYGLVVYLLNEGVSPNLQNQKNGETPLHTAARIRDVKVVSLLMQQEADPKITNSKHETALTIASENKDDDIIELLSPGTQQLVSQHIIQASAQTEHSYSGSWAGMNTTRLDNTAAAIFDDDDDDDDNASLHNMRTHRLDTHVEDVLSCDDDEFDDGMTAKFKVAALHIADKNSTKLETITDSKAAGAAAGAATPTVTLEQKLDDTDKRKLHEIKIARTNPFSKLTRKNTQAALLTMQNMVEKKGQLPKLEAWLEKKKPKPPYSWQKRWVMVVDSHILWSDKQRSIKNVKSARERAKFNGSLNLMVVEEVIAVTKSKSQRKFIIKAKEGTKNKKREYVWKHASREDRDFWVKALKQHIDYMRSMVRYLGTK